MKRIVSLLLAALTLSAAGCSKAPEALDMPSKIQSPVEQALPESGKRLDEIALPEAQTRQDQPVVSRNRTRPGLPRQSRPSRRRKTP